MQEPSEGLGPGRGALCDLHFKRMTCLSGGDFSSRVGVPPELYSWPLLSPLSQAKALPASAHSTGPGHRTGEGRAAPCEAEGASLLLAALPFLTGTQCQKPERGSEPHSPSVISPSEQSTIPKT